MIKIYSVEVLGENVQKYSSTTVSGGGGYVTTANGATIGKTHQVQSTINHHVDQDIWVKDLHSGKEIKLNFRGNSFPVRTGHVLTIAFDELSESWERLVNETTGNKSNANGFFNQSTVNTYYKQYKYSTFWAIGLLIPLINFLVGLIILKLIFVGTPKKVKSENIPDAGINILFSFLSGLALFFMSYTFIVFFTDKKTGFFLTSISLIATITFFFVFRKSCGANFLKASVLIAKRSELLEKEMDQFRKTSISPTLQ